MTPDRSMPTEIIIEDDRWSALASHVAPAVAAALTHRGLDPDAVEVVVLACDDARIAALNADFRDKPRPTNVLSWPSGERGSETDGAHPARPDDTELGDIAIAWDTCMAEADAAGIAADRHVSHLAVHATLHLLGYDHERDGDAALMERIETEILAGMGLPDPYGREG